MTRRVPALAALVLLAGGGRLPAEEKVPGDPDGPADLRKTVAAAGFDPKLGWVLSLADFVRFGSPAAAADYFRGDRFAQLEAEKAAAKHREAVRAARYRADGLPLRVTVPDDVETRGLTAELALPFRLRPRRPFFEDAEAFSGLLTGLAPSEVDRFGAGFLHKDGTIRRCNAAEAAAVRAAEGVVYHPETPNTTLVMTLKGKLDELKAVARGAADYSVSIELTGLEVGRPLGWGWFREDAYLDAGRDCQKLWIDQLLDGGKSPQPVYFMTAGPEDKAKLPELVRATVLRVTVADKDGKAVAAYKPGKGSDGPPNRPDVLVPPRK